MARKTSKVPSRIWKFGLPFGPEQPDRKAVSEQMSDRHRYHNKLIEIETERLERFRAAELKLKVIQRLSDLYDADDTALTEARRVLKENKSKDRTRKVDPIVHVNITDLKKQAKKSSASLKKAKSRIRLVLKLISKKRKAEQERLDAVEKAAAKAEGRKPRGKVARHDIPVLDVMTDQDFKIIAKEITAKLIKDKLITSAKEAPSWSRLKQWALVVDGIDIDAMTKHKVERAATPTYWPTYLRVEEAMAGAKRSGMDPQFKPWRGDGEIAVQFQKGLTKSELFSCQDTRLQIDPVPDRAWWEESRGERRRQQRTMIRMRIGSENRKPIWASFKLQIHRELPDDAVIKWAWIDRERIGIRDRWHLLLNFESKTFVKPQRETGKRCAIDVGWRKHDNDDLRIGYLVSSDGHEEEIRLPAYLRDRKRKGEELQSLIDQGFNIERVRLVAWIKSHRKKLPEWFLKETKSLHAWKSPNRLMRVVWRWGDRPANDDREGFNNRFAGDTHIFPFMEAWRKQYRHLYGWRRNQEKKMLACRKEQYRLIARKIALTYDTVIIENFDLRKIAQHDNPEDQVSQEAAQRSQRFAASLSEFRAALALMASNVGSKIVERDAAHTTVQCFSCEEWCSWDAARYLRHTCEHCGAHWDQDANASRNLLFDKVGKKKRTNGAAKTKSKNGVKAKGTNGTQRKNGVKAKGRRLKPSKRTTRRPTTDA